MEYETLGIVLDRGMPAGLQWYIPQVRVPLHQSSESEKLIHWPMNQVLIWWQDLLGKDLEDFTVELCGNADNESACRQIRAWLKEERIPSFDVIERWVSQEWVYKGTFVDNPAHSLQDRWKSCCDFLVLKGMDAPSNIQIGHVPGSDSFKSHLHREKLDFEILRFPEHSFAEFFSSRDAIRTGLPVEELIRRVAIRWQAPTNGKLRKILFFARAVQYGWLDVKRTLGPDHFDRLVHWTNSAYNHLMQAHNQAKSLRPHEIVQALGRYRNDVGYPFLVWPYDQKQWDLLPSNMSTLLLKKEK